MSPKAVKNIGASVHQRLLDLDPDRQSDFNILLARYAFERWLYRLSKSLHRNRFLLKGAMLFLVWSRERFRTTRDLDLFGFGDYSPEKLREVFIEICRTDVEPDGLTFDTSTLRVDPIRVEDEYQGQRVRTTAHIHRIRIPLQFDIGMGDAVWPAPEDVEFPTLLEMPAPFIRAYCRETVIAEKFQSMFVLGMTNSRMKDFFDIVSLSEMFPFEGERLLKAIQTTFTRRENVAPTMMPLVFSEEFAHNPVKQMQWKAFAARSRLKSYDMDFFIVVEKVKVFLAPLVNAMIVRKEFSCFWPPGGPWRKGA